MPLESVNDGFNVKSMMLEPPVVEQKFRFDPAREISERDWIEMEATMRTNWNQKKIWHALGLGADMTVMGRPPVCDVAMRAEIERYVQGLLDNDKLSELLAYGSAALTLHPHTPRMSPDRWMQLQQIWEGFRAREQWNSFLMTNVTMALLGNPSVIDAETKVKMEKSEGILGRDGIQWCTALYAGVRAFGINIELPSDTIFHVRKTLDILRGERSGFAELAACYTAIAAEHISITPNGITLGAKEKDLPFHPLPRVRTFLDSVSHA